MREEYNSVLSTPTEADHIGGFGRYRYQSRHTGGLFPPNKAPSPPKLKRETL